MGGYTPCEDEEDSGFRMMKKTLAFAVLLLLMLSGLAMAEETDPATPTDLTCLHENTKITIYFSDSPAYSAASATTHRVYGPAVMVTVCQDCGEEIAREEGNAEEYRPHTMKRGTCALCGYREQTQETTTKSDDIPGERTLYASQEADEDVLSLTLTYDDLSALNSAKVSTVLVRSRNGSAAIALNVADMMIQTRETGAALYMMLSEQEDSSFFAGLYLVTDPGTRAVPEGEGISLRFYQKNKADVRVSLVPADSDEIVQTETSWNEHGYWTVQYLEEGTYMILR